MARHALLIGIQDYGSGVGPLRSAPRDIDALNDVLSHINVGYFHSTQSIKDEVICAEPGQKPISSAALASDIQTWCRSHEPDDLVLLYFSGQGFQDKAGALYLAASNTYLDSSGLVDSATIPLYSLAQWLNQSAAREQVVVLDCCFNDEKGQGLDADNDYLDFSALFRSSLFDQSAHRYQHNQRVLLSASTTANYFSDQKSDRLSLYTRYWIEGLMSGAADVDEKDWVSIADVHQYVTQQMRMALPNVKPLLLDPDQAAAQIRLGKACIPTAHRQYRQAIQEFAELSPVQDVSQASIEVQHKLSNRGQALPSADPISSVGRKILDLQRHKLGLSSECAQVIEQQVLQPLKHYGTSLNHYREVMANLLEGRVFNEQVEQILHNQRRRLGLCPDDVAIINQELSYLQKLRNGQQYRQALQQAIASEDSAVPSWPLGLRDASNASSHDEISPMTARTRQELSILQGMLDLSNDDVTLIEQDVMAERTTHHQRLAHYQQRYIQALSQGFALSPLVREELDILQKRLALSNDDVERVEWLVKQGKLQQPSRQTLPKTQPSTNPSSAPSQVRQPAQPPEPRTTTASPQIIPPGALPLPPGNLQRQEEPLLPTQPGPSESIPSDRLSTDSNTPTLFNVPDTSPTQLSTAPVVPTPLGSPPDPSPPDPYPTDQSAPIHHHPLFQKSIASQPAHEPTDIYPPGTPLLSQESSIGTNADNHHNLEEQSQSEQDVLEQENLRKRIGQYEGAFVAAIARKFPISERDRQALHHLQHLLDLSDVQVRHINQRIVDKLNQKEAYYHHTKIQEYAQQFVSFMEQDWPLSSTHRETLSQLQKQLELHDADVHALEHQIVAQHLAKAAAPIPQNPDPNMTLPPGAAVEPKLLNTNPVINHPPNHTQDQGVTELMSGVETSTSAATSSTPISPPSDSVTTELIQASPVAESITPGTESITPAPISLEQDALDAHAPPPISQPDVSAESPTPQSFPQEEALDEEMAPPVAPSVSTATTSGSQGLLATELETHDDSDQASPTSHPNTQNSPQSSGAASGTRSSSASTSTGVPLLTERDIDYGQLEAYLRNKEWKKADGETLDMMCKITSRRVEWLDRQAISELPCTDLKTIDALWNQYSQGRFGFRIQQEIFKSTQASNSNVARFGKQVGWTLWQSEFVGFKYYKQLTFDLSAPYGHLPAKWFWMVPWWESVRSGGLGTGRGGCGDDASEMLSAMMYQFLECSTQG